VPVDIDEPGLRSGCGRSFRTMTAFRRDRHYGGSSPLQTRRPDVDRGDGFGSGREGLTGPGRSVRTARSDRTT